MIRTRITEMLKIQYPLLQGAMAWIATGRLAGAVSEAGGLGIIGAGTAGPEWLKKEIDEARQVTSKPFGVNLVLVSPHIEEIIEMVIRENIPVVTTGAGNPGKYMPRFKEQGIKVIPVVASVALARRLARQGADAVIAEGMESGGHVGEMTTMCLVPMIVDAVDIPVIAAGGIADGRGMVAALALGADGIQMGTRFVCAEECPAHPAYKEKVIKARDRDTEVCGTTTLHPVRAIRNRFVRHFLDQERAGMGAAELEQLGSGRYPEAALRGDIENGSILAGQVAGLVNRVEPAHKIVTGVMQEAESLLRNGLGVDLCLD